MDPALALFNSWAINGWGGSTPEPARSFYQGHAISNANKILALELMGTAAVPGEQLSPTQPIPLAPPPLCRIPSAASS